MGQIPFPPSINVVGCQSMCSFFIFSPSLLSQHWFRGEGGFKVFAFDIAKVFLVVPLYFLTDCIFAADLNRFYEELVNDHADDESGVCYNARKLEWKILN